MRVFKTRIFARFARSERIADKTLAEVVRDAERGLIDADLGNGLLKMRIARKGEGKRGGYRSIVGYREAERAFFIFGFAKSALDNLKPIQIDELRDAAADYMLRSDAEIEDDIVAGRLVEVPYEENSED